MAEARFTFGAEGLVPGLAPSCMVILVACHVHGDGRLLDVIPWSFATGRTI